ncbi:hypothetical protein WJX81_000688 [Elliptochloris bilobata]|uniref:Glycosyltransferase 61 catalytic domain-containing protein n=1 Tax=Elliptochloris bilobata TaxID=381761 RepID=A0AAW1QW18_9CHLO
MRQFVFWEPRYTSGAIDVVLDGRLAPSDALYSDCGWDSDPDDAVSKPGARGGRALHVPGTLLFALAPDGWSLQHFLDGVLPKLVQARELLAHPSVKVLAESHPELHPIVDELLAALNVTAERRVRPPASQAYTLADLAAGAEDVGVSADRLVLPCRTPAIHPQLWQQAQELLGVRAVPAIERNIVAYLPRDRGGGVGAFNGGRHIANEDVLLDNLVAALEGRRERLQVFRHTEYETLPALLAFWARVGVVIGPHGGALSNVMFVPPGGAVVELFPVDPVTRAPPPQLASGGMMYYLHAALLGHKYHFVHAEAVGEELFVDPAAVVRALELALGAD